MPKVKTSKTKDHFDKVDDSSVKCKLCSKILKTGGGTSNMLSHLSRLHPQAVDRPAICSYEDASTSTITPAAAPKATETTIQSYFQHKPSVKYIKKIDEGLALMIASDFQPFSIVEDAGFRQFVGLLNPKYTLPTRQKIRNEIMPQLYNAAKVKLKTILNDVDHLSVTTDLWTSANQDSYMSVTVHFFHDMALKSFVLQTINITGSHTAENLAENLNTVFDDWNTKHKVVAIVTDNASNMTKMCELLQKRNMPCFAHTINLLVQDSLSGTAELQIIIDKCKAVVKYFKKSQLAIEALNTEQIERRPEETPLKLIQEVSTRWNSVFYMLERILKLANCLAIVTRKFRQAPPFITLEEEEAIKDVISILSIFEEATKLISGELYPTSSLVIPIICGFYENLNKLEVSSEIGRVFFIKIKENMNRRLLSYENRTVNKISTYLHPLYQKGFRQTENMMSAKDLIRIELTNYIQENSSTTNVETIEPNLGSLHAERPTTSKLLDFLHERQQQTSSAGVRSASVMNILRMYSETEYKQNQNIGQYWSFNKHLAPLDKIALKFLSVPATSVPSERLFSMAGYTISSRRTKLKPEAVEMLCFLNKNKSLLLD